MSSLTPKLLLPLLLVMLLPVPATAQSSGTKRSKDQPSPAEMEALQKEMDKARRDDPRLDAMMKQMGMDEKMKNAKQVMEHAGPGPLDERGLPRRDAARLARAGTAAPGDAELKSHLQKSVVEVDQKLTPRQRELGAAALSAARARGGSAATLGAVASGLWAVGARAAALHVMGRAAAEHPTDADALNNYAAFLTMSGGEELAIPVLRHLDRRYPKNSTVKNNLGQALFALGEIEGAEKELDAAIKIFAFHSQANLTKSVLQEARGDKAGAAKSVLRSIQFGFSADKQTALRRTGAAPGGRYLAWPFRAPQDPLGLQNFMTPPYPKNTAQARELEPVWEAFKKDVRARQKQEEERARRSDAEARQGATERAMAAVQARSVTGLLPPYFPKASLLLGQVTETYLREIKVAEERNHDKYLLIAKLGDEHRARTLKISEQHEEDFGEGKKDNEGRALCADQDAEANTYLEKVNSMYESIQGETLDIKRRMIDESTYYAQFMAQNPAAFEAVKAKSRLDFLRALTDLQHATARGCPREGRPQGKVKLADFYDIRCDYHTELDFVFTKIAVDCNKMTTRVDIPGFSGKLKENLDTGKVITGSVEVALTSKSVSVGEGPLSAEAGVGVKGYVEFASEGVTDWGLRGGASATLGADLYTNTTIKTVNGDFKVPVPSGPSVKIGADFQVGWNSGWSMDGKGTLNGGMASSRSSGK
jgi:Flp pilus assembly protein TadD